MLTEFRIDDTTTGRLLARDPIGCAGGVKLHACCRNNPVNRKDPLSLCAGTPVRGGVGQPLQAPNVLPAALGSVIL